MTLYYAIKVFEPLKFVVSETTYIYLQEDEDSVEFASRVKAEIAHQGGLVDLEW